MDASYLDTRKELHHPEQSLMDRDLTRRNDERSLLLRLPGELRNIIYRHTLIAARAIDIFSEHTFRLSHAPLSPDKELVGYEDRHYNTFERGDQRTGITYEFVGPDLKMVALQELAPGLVRCCKRVHHEAMSIFLSENTWRFARSDGWNCLAKFLCVVGSNNRPWIWKIQVRIPLFKNFANNVTRLNEYGFYSCSPNSLSAIAERISPISFAAELMRRECQIRSFDLLATDPTRMHFNTFYFVDSLYYQVDSAFYRLWNIAPHTSILRTYFSDNCQARVVVEPGAKLVGSSLSSCIETLCSQGYELVLEPKSICMTNDGTIEFSEQTRYAAQPQESDFLDGLSFMFEPVSTELNPDHWLSIEPYIDASVPI